MPPGFHHDATKNRHVAVDDQLERAAVVFVLSSVLQRVKMEELVPTLIAIAVVFFAVRWLINRAFMSRAGKLLTRGVLRLVFGLGWFGRHTGSHIGDGRAP